jgi:hypothetical protein
MRLWCSLLLFAPALLAQSPHNYWHFRVPPAKKFFTGNPTPKSAPQIEQVKAPPKTCSIPLINVQKGRLDASFDKMAIPPPDGPFAMKYVTPPAPPCDDEKR